MTITLLVITAASIALNVFQLMERTNERKQTNKLVAEGARLEDKVNELQKKYENEVLHKNWAIGRIKDQQAVIDKLSAVTSPAKKNYKARKEASHD